MEMYETYEEIEVSEDNAMICPRCHKKTWYPEIGICTTEEEYDRWNE